jgi:hypothetical protein
MQEMLDGRKSLAFPMSDRLGQVRPYYISRTNGGGTETFIPLPTSKS